MGVATQGGGRRLRRVVYWLLYVAFLIFITTFILFALLEKFPSLAHSAVLQHVKYYAEKQAYVADPQLVFVYRDRRKLDLEFYGDRYSGDEGVAVRPVHYVANYNELGFRVNTSSPPFEAVVIGDSFAEIGEDDRDTFSERLKSATGLSTFNLGRSWYGPYQYLELFKRYALPLHPKYAILCFFSGNDITDTREYRNWLNNGRYYSFEDPARVAFLRRYSLAFIDAGTAVYEAAVRSWERRPGHGFDPELGIFKIGGENVRIKVDEDYWNVPRTRQQLLATEPWQDLNSLLAEFRHLSADNGIEPVALYIPTTVQVYGRFFTGEGGGDVLEHMKDQVKFEANAADALGSLAQQHGIRYINLLPVFQCLASKGKLLYYQFDSHWNREGREMAAEYVAASLGVVAHSAAFAPDCLDRPAGNHNH